MPPIVRCFESNGAIGQYSLIVQELIKFFNDEKAVKAFLTENPSIDKNKMSLAYCFDVLTLTSAPKRMHMLTYHRPQDAHLMTHDPLKNTK